uniref:Uncharacterized protein n=1 Tax=Phlebotomus papatasi TaxID=29031 RepID=A0A1B0DCS9_PHLPP
KRNKTVANELGYITDDDKKHLKLWLILHAVLKPRGTIQRLIGRGEKRMKTTKPTIADSQERMITTIGKKENLSSRVKIIAEQLQSDGRLLTPFIVCILEGGYQVVITE